MRLSGSRLDVHHNTCGRIGSHVPYGLPSLPLHIYGGFVLALIEDFAMVRHIHGLPNRTCPGGLRRVQRPQWSFAGFVWTRLALIPALVVGVYFDAASS